MNGEFISLETAKKLAATEHSIVQDDTEKIIKDLKMSNIYLSKTCDKYKKENEKLKEIIRTANMMEYFKGIDFHEPFNGNI